MAKRKAKAVEQPLDSRMSKATIAPTVAARKTGKFAWSALCAVARGTKYTATELSKGVKVGMSREI